MHPGRERNVLRWEVRHEQLRRQLAETCAALEAALVSSGEPQGTSERERVERLQQLRRQRDDVQRRLQELGPFPGAKMG